MKKNISILVSLLIPVCSYARNIRDVDISHNVLGNIYVSIVAAAVVILFIIVFGARLFHIATKKKYTFKDNTFIGDSMDVIEQFYELKNVVDNSYTGITMAEINASEAMEQMLECGRVCSVNSKESYTVLSVNPIKDFQRIKRSIDGKTYYMRRF